MGRAVRSTGEQQRVAAVHRYRILDTPRESAFDRVAALAARLLGAPAAVITIVDSDRIWLKAAHGLDTTPEIAWNPAPHTAVAWDSEPQLLSRALSPREPEQATAAGAEGFRSHAAAPITTSDGFRLGTVHVLGREPRATTAGEAAALGDLAALVMDVLDLRLDALTAAEAAGAEHAGRQTLLAALRGTLLPPQLPRVPGLDVAGYYHTALGEEVGGDFYDLLETGGGRFAFFLGDVCGRGAAAAGLTSQVRYTLRAGALRHDPPTRTLEELNRALLRESALRRGPDDRDADEDGRFCTVVYGTAEPGEAGSDEEGCFVLTLAGGGHPPAMLVRAEGSVERIAPSGTLVGALPDAWFESVPVTLRPGDALVLYTDGLTEAHLSPTDRYGEDRLAEYLSRTSTQPAPTVVSVLRELLDGFDPGANDDLALLVISIPR